MSGNRIGDVRTDIGKLKNENNILLPATATTTWVLCPVPTLLVA